MLAVRLEAPNRIRDLQRGLYLEAKREPMGALACLEVKMIGMPSGGKLHAVFDEGGLDDCLWTTLNGHEAGNGGYSHLSAVPGTGRRVGLKTVEPILYSTLILHSIALQSTGR